MMDDIWNWICKLSLIAVIFICLNSIIGDIVFRIKYSFPKITATTREVIDFSKEPVQNSLQHADYIKHYGEKNLYALQPQAEYSIAGLVVSKNNNFWFRDIMRSTFDDVCLIDFGIVWGKYAQDKNELYKHWKIKSYKTLGQSRRLEWREKPPYGNPNIKYNISHTHMIPANANVMGALLKIKKNDIVKIDGYLVDIYTDKSELVARTSMTRYDTDSTSRGSGACEDMYVKQVQIGNRIYR